MLLDNKEFIVQLPVMPLMSYENSTYSITEGGALLYESEAINLNVESISLSGKIMTSILATNDIIMTGYFNYTNDNLQDYTILPHSIKIANTTDIVALKNIDDYISGNDVIQGVIKVLQWRDSGKSIVGGVSLHEVVIDIRTDGIYLVNLSNYNIPKDSVTTAYGSIYIHANTYAFVLDKSNLDSDHVLI